MIFEYNFFFACYYHLSGTTNRIVSLQIQRNTCKCTRVHIPLGLPLRQQTGLVFSHQLYTYSNVLYTTIRHAKSKRAREITVYVVFSECENRTQSSGEINFSIFLSSADSCLHCSSKPVIIVPLPRHRRHSSIGSFVIFDNLSLDLPILLHTWIIQPR